jgi:hypothetical protein
MSRSSEDSVTGTISLVPQIVDAVGIPLVAAGGIADASGQWSSSSDGGIQLRRGVSHRRLPLGLEAVLIPRRSFFISDFLSCRLSAKRISSDQQNLPNTNLLRCSLSFSCLAEWQFALIGIISQ